MKAKLAKWIPDLWGYDILAEKSGLLTYMCVNGMVIALMSNYGYRSMPKSLHVSQQKYSMCYCLVPEITLSSIDRIVFHSRDPLCRVD